MSGLMFVCSVGANVKRSDVVELERALATTVVMSWIVSTGVSSIAMMMPSRRVERQRGILAAGVEGLHAFRVIRSLSACAIMTRPSVG